MSRAVYNTTCDFYRGPNPVVGTPDALYRTNVPCRFVEYTHIQEGMSPLVYEVAWLTHPSPTCAEGIPDMFVTWIVTFDFDQFDRVAIPSGVAPNYLIWRPERIKWSSAQRYTRGRLIPLPLPW